jgi:hypothetical protein
MRLPLPEISAAGSPVAAVFSAWSGVPWYVYVTVAVSGPAVYLINRCLICLLGWKALDKVEPSRVAELMVTITGVPGSSTGVRPAASRSNACKERAAVVEPEDRGVG